MGWLRRRLRGLERASKSDVVSIPQRDGSVARFPLRDLSEALSINLSRAAGEDVEPHPLTKAADRAVDRWWRESFYASPRIVGPDGIEYDPAEHGPPEDLSEQALQSESDDAR